LIPKTAKFSMFKCFIFNGKQWCVCCGIYLRWRLRRSRDYRFKLAQSFSYLHNVSTYHKSSQL